MIRIIMTLTVAISIFGSSSYGENCCDMNRDGKTATGTIECVQPEQTKPDMTTLEGVLEKLQTKTAELKSMEAKIEYLFIQDPDLLDSRTLQKGVFYYQKQNARSKIRLNFVDKKIDDEKVQKNIEQIIFDGVWLIRIDHQLKSVKYDQQAEEGKPIEAFEFISRNFPMVGFTKTEELEKDFEIDMLENKADDPNTPIHLRLKPKAESKYAKDYSRLNFWIDQRTFLPSRLVSTTVEGDIYDIRFEDIKANKAIDKKVFEVEVPAGFTVSRNVLEEDSGE